MSRVIQLYPLLMKYPYHVSLIQQQSLLASITRANNMLLIWFQETVSRQLNFQLVIYGECMHKTYLYPSFMKAGSDRNIPVSCRGTIKRNINRSSSLNEVSLVTQLKLTSGFTGNLIQNQRSISELWDTAECSPWESTLRNSRAGNQNQGSVSSSPSAPLNLLLSTRPSYSLLDFCEQGSGFHLFSPITVSTKSTGRQQSRAANWATTPRKSGLNDA